MEPLGENWFPCLSQLLEVAQILWLGAGRPEFLLLSASRPHGLGVLRSFLSQLCAQLQNSGRSVISATGSESSFLEPPAGHLDTGFLLL